VQRAVNDKVHLKTGESRVARLVLKIQIPSQHYLKILNRRENETRAKLKKELIHLKMYEKTKEGKL